MNTVKATFCGIGCARAPTENKQFEINVEDICFKVRGSVVVMELANWPNCHETTIESFKTKCGEAFDNIYFDLEIESVEADQISCKVLLDNAQPIIDYVNSLSKSMQRLLTSEIIKCEGLL